MNIHAAVAGETSQLEREPGFRDADPDYPRGGSRCNRPTETQTGVQGHCPITIHAATVGETEQLKRELESRGTAP